MINILIISHNQKGWTYETLFNELLNQQALMPVFTYDGNSCMDNFEDNYDGAVILSLDGIEV